MQELCIESQLKKTAITRQGCYVPVILFCVQSSSDLQVKELSARLDEEISNATKAAKRDAIRLQARVRTRG